MVDIKHVSKMCSDVTGDMEDIAFIMAAGDLADALPVSQGYEITGRKEPLRPAETCGK